MGKLLTQRNGNLLLLILAVVFPLVFADNQYVLHVMSLGFIWTIAVIGMNLLAGFTGQLSLAHAGFFAVGAYAVGILTTKAGMGFWQAFVLGVIITTIIGFLIGIFALRTKEHFFAIYTLIVGYIVYILIDIWDGLTGGVRGLIGIPVPSSIGPIDFTSGLSMYYLVLFFLVLSIFFATRIVYSLTGRTYIAIRNSEELAQTIGINTGLNKLVSFVISVFYAALAGGLYASLVRFLGPEIANLPIMFDMLTYLIVGGLGTLAGPLVGTMLIVWVTQFLQDLQEYRMLIFGPILTLLVIFYPGGIVGGYRDLKMKLRQRKETPSQPVEESSNRESHVKEG